MNNTEKTYAAKSATRIRAFLSQYPIGENTPAEILADVIHYCQKEGLDFDDELRRAYGYVEAENEEDGMTGADEETK